MYYSNVKKNIEYFYIFSSLACKEVETLYSKPYIKCSGMDYGVKNYSTIADSHG